MRGVKSVYPSENRSNRCSFLCTVRVALPAHRSRLHIYMTKARHVSPFSLLVSYSPMRHVVEWQLVDSHYFCVQSPVVVQHRCLLVYTDLCSHQYHTGWTRPPSLGPPPNPAHKQQHVVHIGLHHTQLPRTRVICEQDSQARAMSKHQCKKHNTCLVSNSAKPSPATC